MPLPYNPLVRYIIYSYLPLYDLLSLAWTSRSNRAQVCAYIISRMRMQLAMYVPNVSAFLSALDDSGAVVAGGAALHLTLAEGEAAQWRVRKLNVYVPQDAEQSFAAFLLGQGFSINSSRHIEKHGAKVIKTYTYNGETIKMVVSMSNSPLFPIVHAQSTLLMTYYTPTTLFLAYPTLTFQRRGIANPLSTNREDVRRWRCHVPSASVFGVYNRCNFRLQTSIQSRTSDILQDLVTHTCHTSTWCAMTNRTSNDHGTLSFTLDDVGTEARQIGDVVKWRLGGRGCELSMYGYETSYARMLPKE